MLCQSMSRGRSTHTNASASAPPRPVSASVDAEIEAVFAETRRLVKTEISKGLEGSQTDPALPNSAGARREDSELPRDLMELALWASLTEDDQFADSLLGSAQDHIDRHLAFLAARPRFEDGRDTEELVVVAQWMRERCQRLRDPDYRREECSVRRLRLKGFGERRRLFAVLKPRTVAAFRAGDLPGARALIRRMVELGEGYDEITVEDIDAVDDAQLERCGRVMRARAIFEGDRGMPPALRLGLGYDAEPPETLLASSVIEVELAGDAALTLHRRRVLTARRGGFAGRKDDKGRNEAAPALHGVVAHEHIAASLRVWREAGVPAAIDLRPDARTRAQLISDLAAAGFEVTERLAVSSNRSSASSTRLLQLMTEARGSLNGNEVVVTLLRDVETVTSDRPEFQRRKLLAAIKEWDDVGELTDQALYENGVDLFSGERLSERRPPAPVIDIKAVGPFMGSSCSHSSAEWEVAGGRPYARIYCLTCGHEFERQPAYLDPGMSPSDRKATINLHLDQYRVVAILKGEPEPTAAGLLDAIPAPHTSPSSRGARNIREALGVVPTDVVEEGVHGGQAAEGGVGSAPIVGVDPRRQAGQAFGVRAIQA